MSDDDAEARRKRAAALREQIADLTKGRRGRAGESDEASEEGAAARRDAPQIRSPRRGGGQGNDQGRDATTGPDEAGAKDASVRRDAPRVRPLSPRDFVDQRMRDLDRGRDGAKDADEDSQ